MRATKVAIIGMGTVGTGVVRLLQEHGDRLARHAGRTLVLEQVVVRDVRKVRGVTLAPGVLTTHVSDVTRRADIRVVALLIGGLEPARTIMLELLQSGKDVVTANKALLAEHGPELFDAARELGRSIAFEASVAGGIPIITNISTCLSANQIESLHGILNGTSNFILTEMHDVGAPFDDVLAQAQRLGYAEADPTMDVDGSDAAQKLAILAHLAFGARVDWKEIPRAGIDTVDVCDVRYAKEMGYRIKLLATADLVDDTLELDVSPALVRARSPLAEVSGPFNAIRVEGDAVGPLFFHGQGAGQMPTASAVVADMIDMAVGRTAITFRTLELWSNRKARVTTAPNDAARAKFYLRVMVEDHPGVLAQVATVLGRHGISIASVLQREPLAAQGLVPLVIMTHETSEGDAARACEEIDALPPVRAATVRMWVRD